MTISFTLPITPISVQHSARARVIRGKFMGMYSDQTKVMFVDSIINESLGYKPETPLEGPLAVRYVFYFERPENITDEYAHKITSDWDNVSKGVQDALSKSGFWLNDKQIVEAGVWKKYVEPDLFPRIEVTIATL